MTDDVITVSGLREVNLALYAYSQQLGDRVVIASLRQGANLIKRQISADAPVKTGKLRRGFRVSKSKIHRGKTSSDLIGVYLTLRTGKDAPFYGRFQNDGWNTKGKARTVLNTPFRVNRRGKTLFSKSGITPRFCARTGRKTLPGKTDVPGKFFIQKAFMSQRDAAVRLIVQSAEAGAAVIGRKVGLA